MTETTHHYPQVIQETVEFLAMFPNLSFTDLHKFFSENYDSVEDLDNKRFKNSLRFGYWKFHNFTNNLSYSL